MIVNKFLGSSTREALRQVRDALGPDALILSNRPVPGGVEIMAVAEQDMAALTGGAPPRPGARHEIPGISTGISPSLTHPANSPAASPSASPNHASPASELVQGLAYEVKILRMMLAGQLAGFAWSEWKDHEPGKIEIMRAMLAAGFSPVLARQLAQGMPPNMDDEKALRWARAVLAHNLRCVPAGEDIVQKGGVYALVGPTGVGKTTTVAKIAARCALKLGANQLALITTDSYRIGAHEQLRIYGKILNAPVYSVKDESDLQLTLSDLANKHLVLIDTVGMSQRDRRIAQQIALLRKQDREVKQLLLLSATAHGNTLDDVVLAYRGHGMSGCILTKVDEAMGLAPAIDVAIRHKLPLHYVTNGQRVPEDLHLANATYLVDRAFRPLRENVPFTPREQDFSLVLGAAASNEIEQPGFENLAAAGG